jgi:transposase-like protein
MSAQGQYFSEALKRQVVAEVEAGVMSAGVARRKYGIRGHSTILKWRRQYGDAAAGSSAQQAQPGGSDEVAMLRNEVKLLKQELDCARMRSVAMETLVELAEKTYKIPIRKNSGARQSSH